MIITKVDKEEALKKLDEAEYDYYIRSEYLDAIKVGKAAILESLKRDSSLDSDYCPLCGKRLYSILSRKGKK